MAGRGRAGRQVFLFEQLEPFQIVFGPAGPLKNTFEGPSGEGVGAVMIVDDNQPAVWVSVDMTSSSRSSF